MGKTSGREREKRGDRGGGGEEGEGGEEEEKGRRREGEGREKRGEPLEIHPDSEEVECVRLRRGSQHMADIEWYECTNVSPELAGGQA